MTVLMCHKFHMHKYPFDIAVMVSAHIVVEYSIRVSVPILVPVSVHPELKANLLELKLATLALIVLEF